MSAGQLLPIRGTIARRWQIPLLVLAVGVLATGLAHVASGFERVTPQQQLEWIHQLRRARALTRANAYIVYLLKDQERPAEQQAELHRQLVGTIYQAEAGFQTHEPENVRTMITSFRDAVQLGATPDANDWTALGAAYQWSGRPVDAIDAFRQALRLEHPAGGSAVVGPFMARDRVHRKLIELQAELGKPLAPDGLTDLEAILEDHEATPGNYLWALEHKLLWLLSLDQTSDALALAEDGRARLTGTEQKLAIEYLAALCLQRAGRPDEAETLMRSLRNNWTPRDELWAKAGWLLGKIQQDDQRPQAALSFYEDVLVAFQSGPIHDACQLGRAECLVMLERHARALEVFQALKERILPQGTRPSSHRAENLGIANGPTGHVLDLDLLRATLTTAAESLLQDDNRRLGIQYLQLALSLLPEADLQQRSNYMSRIADNLVELATATAKKQLPPEAPRASARAVANSTKPARSASEAPDAREESAASSQVNPTDRRAAARSLFQQAAEMYLVQSNLYPFDEEASARALELAADAFDSAGRIDRVVETFSLLVKEHPAYAGRAGALHRLGVAHQARKEYIETINAYEKLLKEYPRSPDALSSMVLLAESRLNAGGEYAPRGVKLLLDIVDDRGPDPLFRPEAEEYRRALILLAEHYNRLSGDKAPDHFELAISRLEDAVALYPEDRQMPRLRFLLAEAYRNSAQTIREGSGVGVDDAAAAEAERRFTEALENYRRVRRMLASLDESSLTGLEATYLRMSYLYIGDCLSDLGKLRPAIEAYREVAWRYENEPAAVSATMQVVSCYQRLGQGEEARAALARLQWLLNKIPAAAFDTQRGMSSRAYWQAMAQRIEKITPY